jgi:hypothetical protein
MSERSAADFRPDGALLLQTDDRRTITARQ